MRNSCHQAGSAGLFFSEIWVFHHSEPNRVAHRSPPVDPAIETSRSRRRATNTEMLLRTPTRRAGVRLLKSLLRASGSDYLVAHFAPGTIERRALVRAGFMRAPGRGYTFVARPLNQAPEDPTLPGSWDLTLGELEIF